MNVHAKPLQAYPAHAVSELISRQPAGYSLARDLYVSEAAFAHDIARIFRRHWLLAGHASSAPNPGDYFLFEMAQDSIIVMRGRDGELRAFANVCRHRGSRLCSKAEGHASVLVCPYHAWAYNLDGSLRSARHMGADFDRGAHGLHPVHIAVAAGLVFVNLAEQPLDFAPARAAIAAAHGPHGWGEARVARRQTYPIAANWKLAVENYLECYHCTPSHPEYSKLHALEMPIAEIGGLNAAMQARTCAIGIDVGSVDDWVGSASGREAVFSFRYALYDGVKTGARGGQPVAPLMGAFRDYDGGVTSTHLGPASFFIAYTDHGVLYRFIPKTALTSEMEVVWLVRSDAREGIDYNLDDLTWLWTVTSEADKRITEENQKGVNSTYYRPGPYAPVEQNAIRYIDWYLNEIA